MGLELSVARSLVQNTTHEVYGNTSRPASQWARGFLELILKQECLDPCSCVAYKFRSPYEKRLEPNV